MRRITTTLALALLLLGCSTRVGANVESEAASARPTELVAATPFEPMPAPSGKPIDVARYGEHGAPCRDEVEGPLHADVRVDTYIGGSEGIAVEVSPDDAGVWPEPSGVDPWPVPFVSVRWPMDYTGVRLAGGEVAVLDGAGHHVATTGRTYRLKGYWSLLGSIGGPKFPHTWIDGFNVCPARESVIPA